MAEEESNNCKHFSIRGFVSEVRERDARKCWPFLMRNSAFGQHVDLLPPLPVKNFRRWDCRSCLQETTAAETSLANGENMTSQNDATETAHRETTKLLVRFSQQSKESNLGVQEDNSTPGSIDDQCPLLYCSKKCDSSPTSGSIKGGIRVASCGCNRSEENAVTAEEKEKRKENVMVIAKSSEISLLPEDGALKSLSSNQDRIALVHRTGGNGDSADQTVRSLSFTSAGSDKEQDQGLKEIGKRKESDSRAPEHRMALGLDVAIPKYGCHQDLDESGDEASDPSIALIGNLLPNRDNARKTGVPVKRLLPKKSPKTRTLNDIMKSAELQNDDKNFSSSEDAGVKGRSGFETPEASKQNDEQPNHGCDLIQDTEATILKRNHSKEAHTNDAEGTCKINWLKEVPVKASLHTGEGEANPIETAPKPATARGLNLNLKFSGHTENKQETVTPGEANPIETAPKPATARGLDLNLEYSGQAENKLETVTPVVEVGRSSSMPQEDMTAQKGNIISEGQHAENSRSKSSGKTQENTHKTAPFSKKKRPLVEDGTPGTSSQQHFQDSSGFQEQAVFPVHIEVNKKQKTLHMSEPESVVNIRRAIELLARKQQQVHLTRTKYDSGETTGNMNDDNGSNNTAGDGAGTSVRTNGDAEFSSKSNKFNGRDQQYHDFDLNQEPPDCDLAEVQAPSPSIGPSVTGAQHSVVDLRRNHPPLNLSTKGLKMLAYCSDHRNQRVPPQNLLSSARDGTCELLNGYPPQVCSNLNSNTRCTGVSQRVPAAEPRNGYYSNMMRPVDIHNVKSVPALNLLGLVHQSARSGEPFHSSRDNGNMGYLRAWNGHGSKFHGSVVGIHNGGNKREENLCRPLRPLPRVGVLGPLLQKEINNASNNSTLTLGLEARNPGELTLRKTNFVARQSDELNFSRTSISQCGISGMIDSSVVSRANPGCSLPSDNIGQIVTGSREEADQPIRSTSNMEECIVNRNPADFAMADEDNEYMIGYHEPETRDQKGKKKRKLE